ncbi:MAG: symmetrical bis(5'-nucleosyl)-tetraphosphatase [Betaproteobacteria bacterium]|nr:symmetrical bis(5'-nucleosyl)-tetraphosphatase [Betaproteobacteria bacterium]
MATYVIGDLQGCYATLQALLQAISFDRNADRLIFVGDIVNRGTGSLACLRFVRDLDTGARMVLGNHDLHLLAVAEGIARQGRLDTLQQLLDAPDAAELLAWLRRQPLLLCEPTYAVVHAGLLPSWSWELARRLASEVETELQGAQYKNLLVNMYGNEPAAWKDDLQGFDRLRVTINAMTRMRTLDAAGAMDLRYKGDREDLPAGQQPWFDCPSKRPPRLILAGHWSALGLFRQEYFIGLDSGCVWGRALTAVRLEDRQVFQAPCIAADLPVRDATEVVRED